MNPIKVAKDPWGTKLKFPYRTCLECRRYPCIKGIENCKSDLAKYGCDIYSEPIIET